MSSVSVSGLCCCVQRVLNLHFSFWLISLLGHCFVHIHLRSYADIRLSPFPLWKSEIPPNFPHAAAATTLFVYDYSLTFTDEVEYIWKRGRWDLPRLCFLWIRYSAMACFVYSSYCASIRVGLILPLRLTRSVMRYGAVGSKQRVSRAG